MTQVAAEACTAVGAVHEQFEPYLSARSRSARFGYSARSLSEEDAWSARGAFGDVPDYQGPRLAAPELTRLAQPNPVS